MRYQFLKLCREKSTRGERRIGEILKRNRIKFEAKVRIGKFECDFKIGRVILEIDGIVHKNTNTEKDIYLFSKGYIPLHIGTQKYNNEMEKEILYLIRENNKKFDR